MSEHHDDELLSLPQDIELDADDQVALEKLYLTFTVVEEIFALNITDILEVIEMQDITPIPDTPIYIKGIIRLRNNSIPVIDIRERIGLNAKAYDDRTCIIIVKHETKLVGIIVDRVNEVVEFERDHIDPPPLKQDEVGGLILGIGKGEDYSSVLINLDVLISSQKALQYHSHSLSS